MDVEHSFVNEREKSVLLLFKHFCNNVYLGQWEAAKADARQLNVQGDAVVVSIRDVLHDITKYPFDRNIRYPPFPWPHTLYCFE